MSKTKLELTWIGKDKRPKLEPRILLEDPSLSYHAKHRVSDNDQFDNKLIFGDNLLALKALEQEYAGKVKCVFIDPPYNTGNAFEYYDDGLEHSIWLGLMRDRLEVLWKLLTSDGLMCIQIDDNEFARLFLLCAEICGESNLKIICVKMSEPSGLKMGTVKRLGTIPKLKEFIILCGKNGVKGLDIERIPKGTWDTEYNIFLDGLTKADRESIFDISEQEEISSEDINRLDEIGAHINLCSLADKVRELGLRANEKEAWLFDNAWRICQCATSASVLVLAKLKRQHNANNVFFVKSARGLAYMVRGTFSDTSAKPRIQLIFADDNLTVHPGDLWVDFKNGKKPEALVSRIIRMSTKAGDLVLDSFAGSGTTGAVAHKMGRRWIMIELGDHCHTHIIQRLKKVIDGDDQGGISKTANWQGGGGFRYYSLAPSLLEQDRWGNWVVNKNYNPAMLAEALCKLEGFTSAPSDSQWWNHGYSSEQDFIYVTTQNLSHQQLEELSDEVGGDRSLLVCCTAFRGKSDQFPNLTLKKIPKMVLSRCEWAHDDYSLNVANLPMAQPEPEVDKPKNVSLKQTNINQDDLFGKEP